MAKKQILPAELGETGLSIWAGRVQEDFLIQLRGIQGVKMFNEMRLNSPVVGALLTAIEQAVRSVDWFWTSDLADPDKGIEDPRLDILNDSWKMMTHSWNDHIIESLTFLPFGWAYFEIVYQRDGDRVLWRKFALRGQSSLLNWKTDEKGGLEGMHQQPLVTMNPIFIPIERAILYRARVEKNNPEGRSILRTAYRPYYFAKNIEEIEGIGIERDLAGLPMITLPPGASTEETDSDNSDFGRATRVVRRVRNDEQAGLVMPHDWVFKLVSSEGTGKFDTNQIISRHEKRILMQALAQFLVLGMDQIGALALSEDQTDFFNMSVNATADIISETITKFAVPRLMALNGFDAEGLKLQHSPAGDINIEMFTKSLSLASDFLTWTTVDEVMLRSLFGLPELSPEEIEEAREKDQERKMEIAKNSPGFSLQNRDDNKAEMFVAGNAPDDDERRQQEGKWNRKIVDFFKKQAKRIGRMARKEKAQ